MKNRHLIAAIAMLAAAQCALAQQTGAVSPDAKPVSGKTRAEVIAELQQAKADGSYDELYREGAAWPTHFVSSKTRAQVIAELEQAKADGSYEEMHREVATWPTSFVSTKTRAEVVAELQKAKEDGSLDAMTREYYAH